MKKFALLLVFVSSFIYAQEPKKEIYLTEIFERAITEQPEDSVLIFDGYKILNKGMSGDSLLQWLRKNDNLEIVEHTDSIGANKYYNYHNRKDRIFVKNRIEIKNSYFEDDFDIEGLKFNNGFALLNCLNTDVSISNCIFEDELKIQNDTSDITLFGNRLKSVSITVIDTPGYFEMSTNEVNVFHLGFETADHVWITDNEFMDTGNRDLNLFIADSLSYYYPRRNFFTYFWIDIKGKINDLRLVGNEFFTPHESVARIGGDPFYSEIKEIGSLFLINNKFRSVLDFNTLALKNQFVLEKNQFNKTVAFTNISFSEVFNLLAFRQFRGGFGIFEDIPAKYFPTGVTAANAYLNTGKEKELVNQSKFDELMRIHYTVYQIHKGNGDIVSANGVYSEMKDLEGRRLKYLYDKEGGFQNYFRWTLNRLLKVYTDHGTNPAKAVTVSMYVIFIFGVFYFFFPSEWDITSKSKLIKNFKDFTQKNDKGYIRPFLSMLLGFIISLINALTLSLNAFTTLGFGRIPTKGLAKYICVIQGFIGWFLLSIFTVALINQVLA